MVDDATPSSEIWSHRRDEIAFDLIRKVFDSAQAMNCENEMLGPTACDGVAREWIGPVIPKYSRRHGTRSTCALHTACLSCDTLLDSWSVLGEEAISPLKEQEIIARFIHQFGSIRSCRDFRRTDICQFMEPMELMTCKQKDPSCTSWLFAADTASIYEENGALNSGSNHPVGAYPHKHANSAEFTKELFLHAASFIFSKQILYGPHMLDKLDCSLTKNFNQTAKSSTFDSSSYLNEGPRDISTTSLCSQNVDTLSSGSEEFSQRSNSNLGGLSAKNALGQPETRLNSHMIPEHLLAALMVAVGKKRKGNEVLRDSVLPKNRSSRAKRGKEQRRYRKSSPRLVVRLPDTVRPIKYGRRSRMDAKAWTCEKCLCVNEPEKYLIAYLPRFECRNCKGFLNDNYEFSFTMARARVTGSCPIGNIKDQGDTSRCIMYSICGALEITNRMSKILAGETLEGDSDEGPVLSTDNLLKTYRWITIRHDINRDFGNTEFNFRALEAACDVAVFEGIQYLDDKEAPIPRVLKAPGKKQVALDFTEISKKLSNGTPLVSIINTGKKFKDLKNGQIYKAPKLDAAPGKKLGLHAIVLIGAGKRRKCYFFHFLNSHGEEFCARIRENEKGVKVSHARLNGRKVKKFVGGFGKVRDRDLLVNPIEFLRYPDSTVRNEFWVPRYDLSSGDTGDLQTNIQFGPPRTRFPREA